MPTYGVDRLIRGNPQEGDPPAGWATFILGAGASIDKIDLYVTGYMDVKHELMSQIGTERLEDGSQISDHVVAMPTKVSMVGIVSDMAMGPEAAADCWERIRDVHKSKDILKVITEWGMYDEMVIKSADTTQTTRGMEFNITLQQIVRVGVTQSTQAISTNPSNPATGRAPEVETGPKALEEPVESATPVDAAVQDLGGGRLLVDGKVIPVQTDAQGRAITRGDGTYITIPEADD